MIGTALSSIGAKRKSAMARLAASLLLLLGSVSAAPAQGLGSALEIYADGLVMQRAGALTCGTPSLPVGELENWQRAKAIFVATLWAHGFPADLVHSVAQRLDAEPATPPDCADKRFLEVVSMAADGDWVASTGYVLKQLDLEPVAEPPPRAQWDDIILAFAEESFAQERMIACVAVRYPIGLPDTVKFWDDLVAETAGQVARRGFPRDEVEALAAKSRSAAIWSPAAPDAVAALKADCDADDAWYRRWSSFGYGALRGRVEAIVGAAPQ